MKGTVTMRSRKEDKLGDARDNYHEAVGRTVRGYNQGLRVVVRGCSAELQLQEIKKGEDRQVK